MTKRPPDHPASPSLPSTLYTEDYFLTACEGYEEFVESHGEHLSRRLMAAFGGAAGEPGMRVLLFAVGEHLFPWELDAALQEVRRVLRPGGMLAIHTAPNRWYDRYAYPLVRWVRTVQGRGAHYPANPRALNVAANVDVHVNEQDVLSLRRPLKRAGFCHFN